LCAGTISDTVGQEKPGRKNNASRRSQNTRRTHHAATASPATIPTAIAHPGIPAAAPIVMSHPWTIKPFHPHATVKVSLNPEKKEAEVYQLCSEFQQDG